MAKLPKRPCPGCGRLVACDPRKPATSNKRRVRHKCPHGTWCTFGDPRKGNQGFNWPECKECLKDRQAEYEEHRTEVEARRKARGI